MDNYNHLKITCTLDALDHKTKNNMKTENVLMLFSKLKSFRNISQNMSSTPVSHEFACK